MSDPLHPVSKGDGIPTDQRLWNGMIAAAQAHRQNQGRTGGGPIKSEIHPANTALVKWSGGSTLASFSVLKYSDILTDPSVSSSAKYLAQRRPAFEGSTPASSTDQFLITIEPIADGKIGRAAVAGLAVVQIDVSSAGHTRAVPVAGETGHLASAETGGVPIVYKPAGTGLLLCMVRIDEGGGSSSSSSAVPCKNLGWLRSGPRSNKAWKVSVVEALGECDCTTLQGGTGDANGTIYAIYNATDSAAAGAGVDVWDVTRNLATCCGCASAQIKVTHATKLAQLILTYKSCVDGTDQTVTIEAECGGDGYVIFDVYAEDLCDPPTPAGAYACTSLFRVLAECVDPPTTACGCAGCVTTSAPFAFKAVLSGFTNAAYNGTFWLESDGTACGFTTKGCSGPTLVYVPGATPIWRLTIGGFTYEVDRSSFNCTGTSTLSITAASGDAPATIDIVGVTADAHSCCTVTGTFNISVSPNSSGSDAIPPFSTIDLTNGNGVVGATTDCGAEDPPGSGLKGWEFRLRCEGDHYYASVHNYDLVSEQEVFPTFSPFGVVFQYTPRTGDCGVDGTLTTVTISEP